jgi:hypothetical protein
MSEEKKPDSAQSGGQSAPGSEGTQASGANAESEKEMVRVPKSVYDEKTKDLAAAKAEARQAKSELEKINSEKAEAERKRLEENNEFKTLFETEKSARVAAETKYTESLKLGEIRTAAAAEGILNLGDANLSALTSKVSIDGETVKGAKEAVAELKKNNPYLFKSGAGSPSPTHDPAIPSGSGGELTWEVLMKPGNGKLAADTLEKDPALYNRLKEDFKKKQRR